MSTADMAHSILLGVAITVGTRKQIFQFVSVQVILVVEFLGVPGTTIAYVQRTRCAHG
jgi:hypothetical protein